MLKSIARVFEFQDNSVSKSTLRRILILMLISLPTWPLMILDFYDMLPYNWLGAVSAIFIIVGAISMIFFVCTRFVNRFYFPDKYLDEWEIRIKHKSMTFAFMCLVWGVAPIVFVMGVMQDFELSLNADAFSLWFVGFLLLLLYIQTFHALWQVRPIDED